MALHWPTFLQRTGSAVVFGIIMMAGLLWIDLAFVLLILMVQTLCLREFFLLSEKITGQKFMRSQKLGLQFTGIVAVILTSLSYLPASGTLPAGDYWPALLCIPILLFLTGALSSKNLFTQSSWLLTGIIYIVAPCCMLIYIRHIDWVWPLALILMIWTNDTMAYIVGSLIGKTPFSVISPKKTWEGTAGGAILTVAGAVVWAYFSEKRLVVDAAALSLCASIADTAGDLLESRLKRMADVKDSGAIMPGHGGALDRFDSLLVATPFAFAYLYIVKELIL